MLIRSPIKYSSNCCFGLHTTALTLDSLLLDTMQKKWAACNPLFFYVGSLRQGLHKIKPVKVQTV